MVVFITKNNITFDPVGFYIPLAVSTICLLKLFRVVKLLDVALLILATYLSYKLTIVDKIAVHVFPAYLFVAAFYLFRQQSQSNTSTFPTGLVFVMTFISLCIPDIMSAIEYAPEHNNYAIVGGLGWSDGLVLKTFGITLAYNLMTFIILAVKKYELLHNKQHL